MPRLDPVALNNRRQAIEERLGATTAARLRSMWDRMPSHEDADQERWLKIATPVVEAAQGRAFDLQMAYLQVLVAETIEFDRQALLASAQIDLAQPFIALANALSNGEDFAVALESGATRAEGVGESAVHWAARSANRTVEHRFTRWERTLSGGACEWCQMVAGQTYATAESATFGHLRCACGVVPALS